MELFSLVRKLVDIPSVTGSEGQIAEFIAGFLAAKNFRVRAQVVDGPRKNVLALADEHPRLIFCTHLDTVPPFVPYSEDDRFVYGRGACDAKGILAAMIAAALSLCEEGTRSLGLLFVVGEETQSDGAKAADAISPEPRYLVMGEPTENVLAAGHKGVLTLRIRTLGRSAHSSTPELGESAVDKLLDILNVLRRTDFGADRVLGRTTLNIGMISGGSAPNIIPGEAEAVLSFRVVSPPDDVLDKVKGILSDDGEVKILSRSPAQKLFTLSGFRTGVMPYGTDIPHLRRYGTALLIGPGSVRDAHVAGEKVAKGELREAVEIYKRLGRRLIAGPGES